MAKISKAIRRVRLAKELSQKEFGDLIGVRNTTISSWERGISVPSIETLMELSQVLNVPLKEFTGNNSSPLENEQLGEARKDKDNILNRYYSLDEKGKEVIQYMLDNELERIRNKQKAFIYPMLQTSDLEPSETVELDYYPQAAGMGKGQDVTPCAPEKLEVIVDQIPKYTDYVIRVTGDSMEPTYHSGDLLFIQNTQVLNKGDIGVFVVEGETLVKELGENELISHNKKYAPIKNGDGCFIQGRVVGKYEN